MKMPGFTAEASVYEKHKIYHTSGVVYDSADLAILPQARLSYTCQGRYCDCDGTSDCIDMINHKCGGWTRCTIINGTLRCICEPRVVARLMD